ncbi:MAG: hypothetical protein ACQKBV_01280 [Puniceicoccales bacterium]
MRHTYVLFSLFAIILAGCQNASETPPPRQELVGGPCSYSESAAVATVSDINAEQVRFLINGELTPYSRQDLPSKFDYKPGAQFDVIEKRITKGTCTPYILEVVNQIGATSQSAERTTIYKHPDPSLR